MNKFLNNLGSRKFLVALISIITGILTLFNCDENLIQFVSSIIMIIVPVITYVITEGVLDHASIKTSVQQILEAFKDYLETEINEKNEELKEIEVNNNEVENNETNDIKE